MLTAKRAKSIVRGMPERDIESLGVLGGRLEAARKFFCCVAVAIASWDEWVQGERSELRYILAS